MKSTAEQDSSPYSAPPEVRTSDKSYWDSDGALIVPHGVNQVTLPAICWVTGHSENLTSRKQTLRTANTAGHLTSTLACIAGPLLGFAARRSGHRALSDLGLFLWYSGMIAYFVLMRRIAAQFFESGFIREQRKRQRWSTYAVLAAVLLVALGVGLAFGFVAGIGTGALGAAAMVVLTKFRLRDTSLTTQMRSGSVAIKGFSDAFHVARRQLEAGTYMHANDPDDA